MPFPLAHPAAVLPLRRHCPRWFSFPALVIGSVCPDLGYCFGALHLEKFSHRLLAGSFGFCLPMGLLLLLLFYLVRRPMVRRLPTPHRRILGPLCARPPGPLGIIVVSLLIGAWTHIFLDSITHRNGPLAPQLAVLPEGMVAGIPAIRVCDVLYALGTFLGVAYVGLAYLNWLERAAGTPGWIFRGFNRAAALLLATLSLLLSFASHAKPVPPGLAFIGFLTVTLVVGWFLVTGWALRDPERHGNKAGLQVPSASTRLNSNAS